MNAAEVKPTKPTRAQIILRVLALIFVIGVTLSLFLLRNRFTHIEVVGYPVLFVLSIIANSTIILPLPGVAIASIMGANPSFNPFWVAVVVGAGAAFGELTGYLTGYGGQVIIQQAGWYDRIKDWMKRYGVWTVLVLSFVPNPLFDMAGIAAGGLRMPLHKFLFFCILGKILKMLMFSYGGAGIIKLFPWMATWM